MNFLNLRAGLARPLRPPIAHSARVLFLGLLSTLAGTAGAQTRQALFDGKTFTGWHTEGEGVWTISEGSILARNPKKDWAHLVSNQTYQNGYVRVRFLNKAGNSGLYVRGAESGIYKVKGMQVDLGAPHKDGSVMRVTDSAYAWFAEITKAVDSGYLKMNGWNELAVDMQGSNLKTYINGKLIWSGANIAGIASTGVLALQLHSGDDNDIHFKDIEILTPTRVPYCPIPGDPANRPGNDPDSALCKPVTIRIIKNTLDASGRISGRGWISGRTDATAPGFRPAGESYYGIFDLRGARIPAFPSLNND